MIPVQLMAEDPQGGFLTYGWWAMPETPSLYDELVIVGFERPVVVTRRSWEVKEVGPAMSMIEAGLHDRSNPHAQRWVCTVYVTDQVVPRV